MDCEAVEVGADIEIGPEDVSSEDVINEMMTSRVKQIFAAMQGMLAKMVYDAFRVGRMSPR